MTELPEPDPRDPRAGDLLDEWRATPEQLSELAGLTVGYLESDPKVSIHLLRVGKNPAGAQLILALLQLLDETQTGHRDVLIARLQREALLYAVRDGQGWSNRTDGLPQIDWRYEK